MNEMNERKQKVYYYSNGGKVWGLSGYMFFWLPFIVFGALRTLFNYFVAWDGDSIGFIFSLGVVLTGILSLVTIHAVDKWAFYSNLIFLFLYTASIIIDMISVFISAANLSQTMNDAVGQTSESLGNLPYFNAVAGFVQSSFATGIGMGTFLIIMGGLIILLMLAVFFYIFLRNRKLFFTSLCDLKKEYD